MQKRERKRKPPNKPTRNWFLEVRNHGKLMSATEIVSSGPPMATGLTQLVYKEKLDENDTNNNTSSNG